MLIILDEVPTQRLDDTTLTAEAIYPINLTQPNKRFILTLHYNGSNCFLFVNATNMYQLKTKNSEVNDYAPCVANISKNFAINNTKKTVVKGIVNFMLILILLIIMTF